MRPISQIPLVKVNNIDKRLSTLAYSRDELKPEVYQDYIKLMEDRVKSPIMIPILQQLQTGKFILTHTGKEVKIPSIIPSFLIMGNDREIRTVIDLTSNARLLQTGELRVDPKSLYTFLHTGFIHKKLVEDDMMKLKNNDGDSLFVSALAFSKLLNKTLDKLYGINVNRNFSDLSFYLGAKYFIHYMVESEDTEVAKSIAFRCTSEYLSIDALERMVPEENPLSDLEGYQDGILKFLDNLLPLLVKMNNEKSASQKVNARQVMMEWVLMYGPSTLIALEYVPYFYHMLHSTVYGGMLVKDFMIESAINKLSLDVVTRISSLYR